MNPPSHAVVGRGRATSTPTYARRTALSPESAITRPLYETQTAETMPENA